MLAVLLGRFRMLSRPVGEMDAYKDVFLSFNHLVAVLQQPYLLEGKTGILTGLAPTLTAPAQQKQPMGFQIKPGTVFLGYQVVQWLHLKRGDTLTLNGERFRVEQTLSESGTDDDIRVFGRLPDVQQVLHLRGRINGSHV